MSSFHVADLLPGHMAPPIPLAVNYVVLPHLSSLLHLWPETGPFVIVAPFDASKKVLLPNFRKSIQ
jgi:hypothetical protein